MEEMNMNWSSWKNIDESSGHYSHAVYEVRLVNTQGTSVAINRFLDKDEEGLLSIGMTTNMERRRKQFISGEDRCQGHSEGNLLFFLKEYSRFKTKHIMPKYQYRFQKVNSEDEAKRKERKLIKDYVKQYGEVPPLNSAIPGRYDEMSWDE